MLSFLPPVPAAPQGDFPRKPVRSDTGAFAAVLVSLVAFCAIIAPIGWSPRQQRATSPTRVRPLVIDADLQQPLARIEAALAALHRPSSFRASQAALRPSATPWAPHGTRVSTSDP